MQTKTYSINKAFYKEKRQVNVELLDGLKWAETGCTQAYYDGQIDLITAVEHSDEIEQWLNDGNTSYVDVTEVGPYYFLVIHSVDADTDIPRCSMEDVHKIVDWDNLFVVQFNKDTFNPYSITHLIGIDASNAFLCDDVIWYNLFGTYQISKGINTHVSIGFDNLQTGPFQHLYINKALLDEEGARFYYTMLRLVLSKMNIEFENEHTDKTVTWDNYIEKLSPETILETKRIAELWKQASTLTQLIKDDILETPKDSQEENKEEN